MKALIFDLDDTLFDHAAAMRAFLRATYALPDAEISRLLAVDRRGKERREIFCEALARAVGDSAESVWHDVQTRLGSHATLDAPALLALASKRFETAILTNGGSVNQRAKVKALGLDRVLVADRILISAEIGVSKPDARAFRAALDAVHAVPGDALYIGDDPEHDIMGARAAGLRTCWVARGRAFPDTPPPNWTIDSIADLPSIWDQFQT